MYSEYWFVCKDLSKRLAVIWGWKYLLAIYHMVFKRLVPSVSNVNLIIPAVILSTVRSSWNLQTMTWITISDGNKYSKTRVHLTYYLQRFSFNNKYTMKVDFPQTDKTNQQKKTKMIQIYFGASCGDQSFPGACSGYLANVLTYVLNSWWYGLVHLIRIMHSEPRPQFHDILY